MINVLNKQIGKTVQRAAEIFNVEGRVVGFTMFFTDGTFIEVTPNEDGEAMFIEVDEKW